MHSDAIGANSRALACLCCSMFCESNKVSLSEEICQLRLETVLQDRCRRSTKVLHKNFRDSTIQYCSRSHERQMELKQHTALM